MPDLVHLGRSLFLEACNDFDMVSRIRVDLARMAMGVPGDLTLSSSRKQGTPLEQPSSPDNTATLRLHNLQLQYANDGLSGRGTILLPNSLSSQFSESTAIDVTLQALDFSLSNQPLVLTTPFDVGGGSGDVSVRIPGTPIATARGAARMMGILRTDWTLKIGFEPQRLQKAVQATVDRRGENGRIAQLGSVLTHPGFDLSAVTRLALPVLGRIPLSKIRISSPSILPIRQPLSGSMLPFAYGMEAKGLVPTPPGTLFDFWGLGLGYSSSQYDERRGTSFTAAFVPKLNVKADNALERFPVYAYLEYKRVHRVGDGIEIGYSLTLQPSSIDIARLTGATNADQDVLQQVRGYLQAKEGELPSQGLATLALFGKF